MKIFLKKIILFTSILVIVLIILDYSVTKGLKKSQSYTFNNLNKIFNSEINADLLVNGSSKALYQISPRILDSVLELNSYNLGMDGTEFIPQKMQFDLYLEHNKKPETIVQIVSNTTLIKKEELFEYMKFAPYLDENEIRKVTKQYKGFSFFDYYVPFIKYSGSPNIVINGLLNFINIDLKKDTKYKGYSEKNIDWDNSFNIFTAANKDGVTMQMDSKSTELFENYIIECKNKKIAIFLVYPPTYSISHKYINNRAEIISYYSNISRKYEVPFLDYSNMTIAQSKDYFYNSQHLNKKGAELFSKKLSNDIKFQIQNILTE